MRFQVPQFIEIEDKVFGPFSFKQFVYIAGGIGVCFVFLRLFPRFIAIILIIPVVVFSLLLAFKPINNRPFINLVESFFKYLVGPRLYLWRRSDKATNKISPLAQNYKQIQVPKLEGSKLNDLTWSLDVRKTPSDDEG